MDGLDVDLLGFETGDAGLLQTSVTRWADMVAAKTYLTGGNGSRHEGVLCMSQY